MQTPEPREIDLPRRPSDLVIASYYLALAAVVIFTVGALIMIGGMGNG